ncbi:MAG: hypothetical protein COT92_01135 [Candidatus Doudnabacteria bacterium CG10_big_fil_rev_8_21_14_0_10_42_18]|uniref:Bacterial bifunctional deaminase-reductase C-terminal domain-containing protein n=1 Tax=Candidatus Doudnabacteria bacterium CG10_big_fil_rev_8_21_14_0_10_42_18 TaxID=1974552 RepID=A0A2H0VBH6_9BACT|nr:MAG: hypothetical protein COT92_01135 [Candidatus Doudnabacteria bacterium CG10_big_fil_rev_8_21_14_0_10_42_18]
MSIKFIAIAAVSLDGKIAKHKNHPSDWTSKEDKKMMKGLLNKCDVVLVGNNTYKTAREHLSKINCIIFTKSVNKPVKKSENLLLANPDKVDIKKLIARHGYKTVAILGGAQTYTYCLRNGMFDELYLTIEPIVFGKGIGLFDGIADGIKKFKLTSVKSLNKKGSVVLRYKTGSTHQKL